MALESQISIELRRLRKQNNLTQAELAEQIGIGQTAIANYENGKRFPDEKNLVKLADYFGATIDSLFGRNPPQTETAPENSGFSYKPSELGDLTAEFLDRSQQSGNKAVELILDLLRKGFNEEQIMLDLLEAAMIRAGELWAEGRYNEAMEHQLSTTVVQSILTMKTLSTRSPGIRGRFAAISAAGEQHNIGLRMLSRFLELDGWEGYFLGTSVPARSLQDFISTNGIELVLITATLNENADSLCSLIRAVKSADNSITVMAGGAAASMNRIKVIGCGADYIHSSISETIEVSRQIRKTNKNLRK